MTEKQRLILHIGLHKTGTTYLQKTFAHNVDVFAKAGVVPAGGFNRRVGNHHRMRDMLVNGEEKKFFSNLEGHTGTILLSSEGFVHHFSKYSDKKLAKIAQRLTDRFDLRVVLVLRRQDYLKESVFAQQTMDFFQGKIQDVEYHFDFNTLVQRLENAFGHDRIALGVYRDDRRDDLMAMFLELAGIDLDPATLEQVPPQWVSLHRRKIALLATVHKRPHAAYIAGREAVAESDEIPNEGVKYQMSPEERRDFLRQYQDGNRLLGERFGFDADTIAYLTSDALDDKPWMPVARFTKKERAVFKEARDAAMKELKLDKA